MTEFFKDGMAIPALVKAIRDLSLLSEEEKTQALSLEEDLASRGMDRPVALEAWLLKVVMTAQYAAGMLERVGFPRAGLEQFYKFYTDDQKLRFATMFPDSAEQSVKQLDLRMSAYDQALHQPRTGEPGREVAALFCRFLGADKESRLADFSHDLCSELSRVFAEELERLASAAKKDGESPS